MEIVAHTPPYQTTTGDGTTVGGGNGSGFGPASNAISPYDGPNLRSTIAPIYNGSDVSYQPVVFGMNWLGPTPNQGMLENYGIIGGSGQYPSAEAFQAQVDANDQAVSDWFSNLVPSIPWWVWTLLAVGAVLVVLYEVRPYAQLAVAATGK